MRRLINDLLEKVFLPFNFHFISTLERNTSPCYWLWDQSLFCNAVQQQGVNLFLANNHRLHNLCKDKVYFV